MGNLMGNLRRFWNHGGSDLSPIINVLNQLKDQVNKMSVQLDALTAQVTKNTDVVNSAIALIGSIKAQLDAAGTDPIKLAALSATLGSSDDALAAAIVANTPAA